MGLLFEGAPVRRTSTVLSSILLVIQAICLVGTLCVHLASDAPRTHNAVSKAVLTRFYHYTEWKRLRLERSLVSHSLIALVLQALLLPFTALLVYGAAKRHRWLLVPWLVIWGVGLVLGLVGAVLCVTEIPGALRLLALLSTGFTAFFMFPCWFFAIHLFANLSAEKYRFQYDTYFPEDNELIERYSHV